MRKGIMVDIPGGFEGALVGATYCYYAHKDPNYEGVDGQVVFADDFVVILIRIIHFLEV
jgi:hypothetical protein